MKRIVNQKEMLVKSLGNLFFSCGSNTDVQTFDTNYDDVIEAIRNS